MLMQFDYIQGSDYYDSFIYTEDYYDDYTQELTTLYVINGSKYATRRDAESIIDAWANARNETYKYAMLKRKCEETQMEVGFLYSTTDSLKESLTMTKNKVSDANADLASIDEEGVNQVKDLMVCLTEDMVNPIDKSATIMSHLDDVNGEIKKAGNYYTEQHNKWYREYSELCIHIGASVENFGV